MKINVLFLQILVTSLLFSCHNNRNDSIIPTIHADSKLSVKLSDLFSTVKIIALETNDSSLVGLEINKFELYKDRFFILNRMQTHSNLLCFNNKGDFLYKIDKIGNGPQEYSMLKTFWIDKSKDNLCLSIGNNEFDIYDLNGNFIKRIHSDDFYVDRQVVNLDENQNLVYNDKTITHNDYNIFLIDSESFNITDSYSIPEPLTDTGSYPLSFNNNQILFISSNDTIYQLSGKKINPAYFVDQREEVKSSKRVLTKIVSSGNYNKYMQEASKLISSGNLSLIESIFENKKHIILSIVKSDKSKGATYEYVVYDKDNKNSYNSRNISYDMFNMDKSLNDKMLFSCDNFTITIYYDLFPVEEIEKLKDSKYITDQEKEILINKNILNNPLIFYYEN